MIHRRRHCSAEQWTPRPQWHRHYHRGKGSGRPHNTAIPLAEPGPRGAFVFDVFKGWKEEKENGFVGLVGELGWSPTYARRTRGIIEFTFKRGSEALLYIINSIPALELIGRPVCVWSFQSVIQSGFAEFVARFTGECEFNKRARNRYGATIIEWKLLAKLKGEGKTNESLNDVIDHPRRSSNETLHNALVQFWLT